MGGMDAYEVVRKLPQKGAFGEIFVVRKKEGEKDRPTFIMKRARLAKMSPVRAPDAAARAFAPGLRAWRALTLLCPASPPHETGGPVPAAPGSEHPPHDQPRPRRAARGRRHVQGVVRRSQGARAFSAHRTAHARPHTHGHAHAASIALHKDPALHRAITLPEPPHAARSSAAWCSSIATAATCFPSLTCRRRRARPVQCQSAGAPRAAHAQHDDAPTTFARSSARKIKK